MASLLNITGAQSSVFVHYTMQSNAFQCTGDCFDLFSVLFVCLFIKMTLLCMAHSKGFLNFCMCYVLVLGFQIESRFEVITSDADNYADCIFLCPPITGSVFLVEPSPEEWRWLRRWGWRRGAGGTWWARTWGWPSPADPLGGRWRGQQHASLDPVIVLQSHPTVLHFRHALQPLAWCLRFRLWEVSVWLWSSFLLYMLTFSLPRENCP